MGTGTLTLVFILFLCPRPLRVSGAGRSGACARLEGCGGSELGRDWGKLGMWGALRGVEVLGRAMRGVRGCGGEQGDVCVGVGIPWHGCRIWGFRGVLGG